MGETITKNRVFISIGSNLGDKKENCEKALAEIEKKGIATVLSVSRYYRTEPVDFKDQAWFVNAAACIETALIPEVLLAKLKQIETELGTVSKSVRFGPRIIDIDILLYDALVMDSKELIIPHERMHERVFVLKPLCDINAELIHPVLKLPVSTLLQNVDDEHQGIQLLE